MLLEYVLSDIRINRLVFQKKKKSINRILMSVNNIIGDQSILGFLVYLLNKFYRREKSEKGKREKRKK